MPWQEVSALSSRTEFVLLAGAPGANISELCKRFGISRDIGYKWLKRFKQGGAQALVDQSKKPKSSPNQTPEHLEQRIRELRLAYPNWGARKIRTRLLELGEQVPSASTVHTIIKRQGLLNEQESDKHKPWLRFEHEAPNRLWQMDFKGHFAMEKGRCHPLTLLDDHSRYSLCLEACSDEKGTTVQQALVEVFRRYGLPERMTMDNGSPWGQDEEHVYTPLTVWLIRLGVRVSHSRPYHPQTQGKLERFHRTLNVELLKYQTFRDIEHAQEHFDRWRECYNSVRPHEALGMGVPASRYQVSWRPYPESLPELEYGPDDLVKKVHDKGVIFYKGKEWKVSKAFKGSYVALRPTITDGVLEVYFCNQLIAEIDLRENISVSP
jgi:transposase InsO family protein